MTDIIITRIYKEKLQTRGYGIVTDHRSPLFTFTTLELPWRDNLKNVSCIPPGIYDAFKRISPKRGTEVIELIDVPNRGNIQIHPGNCYTDILGCILPGRFFMDINIDNIKDVTYSSSTFKRIMELTDNQLRIIICSHI